MGLIDTAARVAATGPRQTIRVGRWAAGQALAPLRRSSPPVPPSPEPAAPPPPAPKDLGDADLTNKVASIVLRGMSGPDKGRIDINVVDGVVFLRGVARTPARIKGLEAKARAIPEVVDVHNLLHLPDTPAPTRTDTPARQRRTRRKATPPAAPRTEPRRVNADKTIARDGEPLPAELARERRGRQPAPFGADGNGSGGDAA